MFVHSFEKPDDIACENPFHAFWHNDFSSLTSGDALKHTNSPTSIH